MVYQLNIQTMPLIRRSHLIVSFSIHSVPCLALRGGPPGRARGDAPHPHDL